MKVYKVFIFFPIIYL